ESHFMAATFEQADQPGEAVEAVGRGMGAAVPIAAAVPPGADRVEQQQECGSAHRHDGDNRARTKRRSGAAHAAGRASANSAQAARACCRSSSARPLKAKTLRYTLAALTRKP